MRVKLEMDSAEFLLLHLLRDSGNVESLSTEVPKRLMSWTTEIGCFLSSPGALV